MTSYMKKQLLYVGLIPDSAFVAIKWLNLYNKVIMIIMIIIITIRITNTNYWVQIYRFCQLVNWNYGKEPSPTYNMAVTTNLISLGWQNTFCLTNVIMQTQGNILHNDGVRQKLRCFPEKHASLFTTRLKCVWHSFYQNASQVPTLKDGEYMYTNLRPRANSVQTVDTQWDLIVLLRRLGGV